MKSLIIILYEYYNNIYVYYLIYKSLLCWKNNTKIRVLKETNLNISRYRIRIIIF